MVTAIQGGSWDPLLLAPGQVAGLVGPPGYGLTRLGLRMLADHTAAGIVACLDVRGWLHPEAAWEVGIPRGRLVFVRCDDPVRWARVAATLLDGVAALYAEVPRTVKDAQLRTLGAQARARRTPLLLRSVRRDLPAGLVQVRLEAHSVDWKGADLGHGRLTRRRIVIVASGKAMRGMSAHIELEDDGTNAMHLVSGLAAAPSRRAAG